MNRPEQAIHQLENHQQQIDACGAMVGVSRQALDELLTYLKAPKSEVISVFIIIDNSRSCDDAGGVFHECWGSMEAAEESLIDFDARGRRDFHIMVEELHITTTS